MRFNMGKLRAFNGVRVPLPCVRGIERIKLRTPAAVAANRSGVLEQVVHHIPVNIGQAEIAAGMAIGQPLVIEP